MVEASRRRFLAQGAGAVGFACLSTVLVASLAACDAGDGSVAGSAGPSDDGIRADVAQAERRLIAEYDRALPGASAGLRPTLEFLRDQHAAHLAAVLGADAAAPPDTSTSASDSAEAAGDEGADPVAVLLRAERDAFAERTTTAVGSTDPGLTRLLALIAAAEASHVPYLQRMTSTGRVTADTAPVGSAAEPTAAPLEGDPLSTSLAAVVAGEDAAVWAYGVVGAHLAGANGRQAHRLLDQHRAARQRWASRMANPPAAAVAYDTDAPIASGDQARELAIVVERRLVGVYADAAAATQGDLRAAAIADGAAGAARAVQWGAKPAPFGT